MCDPHTPLSTVLILGAALLGHPCQPPLRGHTARRLCVALAHHGRTARHLLRHKNYISGPTLRGYPSRHHRPRHAILLAATLVGRTAARLLAVSRQRRRPRLPLGQHRTGPAYPRRTCTSILLHRNARSALGCHPALAGGHSRPYGSRSTATHLA